MSYKEINIRALHSDAATTEIMNEIAAARADGVELIRFNLRSDGSEEAVSATRKVYSSLIRTLRGMKQKGRIQFIATEESFVRGDTESIFLANKYPDLFSSAPASGEDDEFVFVKI